MNKVIVLLLVAIVAVGIALSSKDTPSNDMPPQTKAQTASKAPKKAAPAGNEATAETAEQATAADAPQTPATLPESIKPVIYGKADAPVVMKEYASFSCSHCATFHNDRLPDLKEDYINDGNLRIEVHSFVRNQQDLRATMLIQCLDDEAKRRQFMKVLFKSQSDWAYSADFLNNLKNIANVGGVNAEAFDTCVNDKKLEEDIIESRRYFQNVVKVASTPYFLIGNEVIQGVKGIKAYRKVVDAELKKAK